MLTTTGLERAKQLSAIEMTEADGIFGLVQRVQVQTVGEYETTAGWLRDLKGKQKELEADRKEIVDPLTKAVKLVNDLFRKPLERLKAAENVLKTALLDYQDRAATREHAALAAAVQASNAGNRQAAVALIAQASAQQAHVAGISTKDVYRCEVTDASLLPREFLIPDEKAIGELVRAKHGQIEIPGVTITIEKSVTARAS